MGRLYTVMVNLFVETHILVKHMFRANYSGMAELAYFRFGQYVGMCWETWGEHVDLT